MNHFLDFEEPIARLEAKILELRRINGNEASDDERASLDHEIARLQAKADEEIHRIYAKLTPWQKVQIARHPARPHFLDVVQHLFEDFVPLAGDRLYGEDHALIGGLASFRGRSVVILGHEKGRNTEERVFRNFGMARPEGYRKAQRLMRLAERFDLPLLSFIDTSGAYPGIGAEARGQAEAIAKCLEVSFSLATPTLAVILGEGGSGGAVACAATDQVLMLEHAIYSVISPEGCASILWRDSSRAEQASEALRLTAGDLYDLGLIDGIIKEPLGGAHRNHARSMTMLGEDLQTYLALIEETDPSQRIQARRDRFMQMGRYGTV